VVTQTQTQPIHVRTITRKHLSTTTQTLRKQDLQTALLRSVLFRPTLHPVTANHSQATSTTVRVTIIIKDQEIQVIRGHQPLVTLPTTVIQDLRTPAPTAHTQGQAIQVVPTAAQAIPEVRIPIQGPAIQEAAPARHVQAAATRVPAIRATAAVTRVPAAPARHVQAAATHQDHHAVQDHHPRDHPRVAAAAAAAAAIAEDVDNKLLV